MASRLEASDRVTLLLAFVPYLLRHGVTHINVLAQHFDITPQQATELINLLAVSGIPGDSGMYQHQDLFDINWDLFESEKLVELWNHVEVDSAPRFSAREAAALVAGLKYISSVMPDSSSADIESLLVKIASASSGTPENILVAPARLLPHAPVIAAAIGKDRALTFSYTKGNGQTKQRHVDPIRLDVIGGIPYLRGWCRDAQAIRTFRCDRMRDVKITDDPRATTVSESELPEELFEASELDLAVKFIVPSTLLSLLSAYQPRIISQHSSTHTVIEVVFAQSEAVPIFMSQIPGAIAMADSPEVSAVVRNWAQSALDQYNQ